MKSEVTEIGDVTFPALCAKDNLDARHRWLVPAAPKRETREETEKRYRTIFKFHPLSLPHREAFMAGAGWEP